LGSPGIAEVVVIWFRAAPVAMIVTDVQLKEPA
jgi:hypothetical protein